MKFILYKASDDDFRKEFIINTIDDLKAIYEEYRANLVINFDGTDYVNDCDCPTLIVYDDYLE